MAPGPPTRRSGLRRILAGAALLLLAAAAFTIPIPLFYEYLPGPVRDVEGLVEVREAATYSSEGRLYLTTVSVDIGVTLAELVEGVFDRDDAIVLKNDVTGGASFEELEQQQRREMEASKRSAREVALSALGYGEPQGDGAKIIATLPDSPAAGVLREDDVVLAINGEPVSTSCEVGTAISEAPVGEQVRLTLRRDGERTSVSVTTIENRQEPGTSLVGILLDDINYRFRPGIEVDFKTGEIAGPSAGLMFSLALYDRLTPDDLTAGRQIAGTGTISCDGGVGAIGGIEQKVAGAEKEGAEIFLAPVANLSDARTAAEDIEVVSVATFDEAIAYLEGLE